MAIYEYACTECKEVWEETRSMKECLVPTNKKCPKCSAKKGSVYRHFGIGNSIACGVEFAHHGVDKNHKNGGFQPFQLPMYNCEFVLYGRQGSPKFIDTKAFPTCFSADRTGHSKKPAEFYSLIRRVCDGKLIDIFNRGEREGFESYGNQTRTTT